MFDFAISYEKDALRVAARTFFMQVYGRLLFWMLLPYPVALGCAIFLRVVTDISWVTWLLVYVALSPLYWVYLYWRQRRRLLRGMTGTVRVRLTDAEFSIASERGSHAWPWKTFKFVRRDSANLLLFLARSLAIIVPTKGVPEAAIDFVLAHIPRGNESRPR